jgi:gliding motility-associated-like protein
MKGRGILLCLLCGLFGLHLSAQLNFIPNQGQWSHGAAFHVRMGYGGFFAETSAYTLNLLHAEDHAAAMDYFHHNKKFDTLFRVRRHAVRMQAIGSNSVQPEGLYPGQTRFHYYLGNNPAHWAGNLPAYAALKWQNIYPDCHLLMESEGAMTKTTWLLEPLADVGAIRMRWEGADSVFLDEAGRLHIQSSAGELLESRPVAWQMDGKDTQFISCRFGLNDGVLRFITEGHNPALPLWIDPILVFSTYSGSRGDNFGFTATYDDSGHFYSGGIVDNAEGEYPVTTGAYQTIYGGGVGITPANLASDVAISKFSPDGKQLLYATYIGGNNDEYPHSLVVDRNGNLLVLGTTASQNFPAKDGYDTTFNGGNFDIFVFKLSPDGSTRLGGTFYGGSSRDGLVAGALRHNYADDFRGDIYTDDTGTVYIATCTQSNNVPVTSGAFQSTSGGGLDALILSFDSSLQRLRWSTYLGKSGSDAAYSVKLDSKGKLWVAGGTTSNNLEMVDTGYQRGYGGGTADGWIACMQPADGKVLKTSYFGTGDYDQVYFLDTDVDDQIYAMGQTRGAMTRTAGTYGQDNMGQFICRFNNALDTLQLLTTFGSVARTAQLCPSAFMVDYCYNIYVSGWGSNIPPNTQSTTAGLTVSPNALQPNTDGADFYLYVLSRDAKTLQYATFFGGTQSDDHVDGGTSRFDKSGIIYQSVCASCPDAPPGLNDFPITPGAVFPTNVSYRCSNASFKIDFQITYAVRADFDFTPKSGCAPKLVQFTNQSRNGKRFRWDFGDGQGSTQKDPQHRYNKGGTYRIVLYCIDSASCNVTDSAVKFLRLTDGPEVRIGTFSEPCSQEVFLEAAGTELQPPTWYFSDGDSVVGFKFSRIFPKGQTDILVITRGLNATCIDTQQIRVNMLTDSSGNLEVPNTFTPNGDRVNDCYRFGGISSDCDEIEWCVYNRWGLLVFQTKDAGACWNGRVHNIGGEMPEGVYYYLFKRTRLDGGFEQNHGTIQLIR